MTIFSDPSPRLQQITRPSFQQVICANLNPTSSGLLGRDERSDLGDIFRECLGAKVEVMVDCKSSGFFD